MNHSNYYDLNLVEGTDIFNPLTTDVPNYEIIDEVMHENEVKTVGTASHILAANIHELTRVNEDNVTFRFTATAPFTAGQTFTVDGVQVTALLPNGQTLPDDAFVIGSTIICSLVGSTLTVNASAGSAIAKDAEKLGGELPEYYGTAADVAQAQTVANAAGVLAETASRNANDALSAVSAINSKLIRHLWHNSNPTERHKAGDVISVPQNDCDLFVYVIANSSAGAYPGAVSYTLFGTVGQRLYLWKPSQLSQSKVFLVQANGSLYVETSDDNYTGVILDVYGFKL